MVARPAFPLDRHVLAQVRMHWPLAIHVCTYGAVCFDKKKIERRKIFFVGHVMYRHTCNLGLLSDLGKKILLAVVKP